MTQITMYQGDIPKSLQLGASVAVDTESTGLVPGRDRLCLVQLSSGDGRAHLVHFKQGSKYSAPNLKRLLNDPEVLKIMHFARADMGFLTHFLGIEWANVYCTKIASRLARTFNNKHGLKDLAQTLLGVELPKEEQTSDWGGEAFTDAQKVYAANDVLYLHAIREKLDVMLKREGRYDLALGAFSCLPARVGLDLAGFYYDIFAHESDKR